MEQTLEELARRCVGVIDRLYTSQRFGVIVARTGERLLFRRRNVVGYGLAWSPQPGQPVMFNRVLGRKGLHAVKVRPLDSRRRQLPASSESGWAASGPMEVAPLARKLG